MPLAVLVAVWGRKEDRKRELHMKSVFAIGNRLPRLYVL